MRGEQHFGPAECFWPTNEQRSAKPPALLTVAGSFQNTGPRPASRWTIEVVLRYCRLNWWSGKNRPPPTAHRNMDIHTGISIPLNGHRMHLRRPRSAQVPSPAASWVSRDVAFPRSLLRRKAPSQQQARHHPLAARCDTAAELACRHWAGLPRQNVPQPARRLLSELLAAGATCLGHCFGPPRAVLCTPSHLSSVMAEH